MIQFLIPYAARIVGPRFAKPFIIIVALCVIIGSFMIIKGCYDSSVINKHDAEQAAKTERAARKADAQAAEQRRIDDAMIAQQEEDAKDAIRKVQDSAPSAVATSHNCQRLRRIGKDTSRLPECN